MDLQRVCMLVVLVSLMHVSAGRICYTCNDYDHPRDCVYVSKCQANQECYVESNVTQSGTVKYTSGCLDAAACKAILRAQLSGDMIVGKRAGTVCKLCCHGDYCNSELCDLHKEENFGPRCLDCNDVKLDDPRNCLSVTQCARDEDCKIRNRQHRILDSDVQKRVSFATCAKCCDRSYCNAEICGNTTSGNHDFNVFNVIKTPQNSSETCDDSSFEACQYFINVKGESCLDVNVQRICPKSCNLCVDRSCMDNATFDCAIVDRTFNICQNVATARKFCRKHCDYCNYVHGSWGSWSLWSTCSRTCVNGQQSRTRTCSNPPPRNGGDLCQGEQRQTKDCLVTGRPIPGGWTEWENWGNCLTGVLCNFNGTRVRHRRCSNPSPDFGRANCTGNSTEQSSCYVKCGDILRLVNGTSTSGRLEIYINGVWGTICDDIFENNLYAAKSVCKTLGLPFTNAGVRGGNKHYYGQGKGPILIDEVRCSGIVDNFPLGCKFELVNDCGHHEDVGVSCQ